MDGSSRTLPSRPSTALSRPSTASSLSRPSTASRRAFGQLTHERANFYAMSGVSTGDAKFVRPDADRPVRPHAFHASFTQPRPPLRRPPTADASYGKCGSSLSSQALSTNRTQPSFGFGTAPARPALFGATVDRSAAFRTRKPLADGHSNTPFLNSNFDQRLRGSPSARFGSVSHLSPATAHPMPSSRGRELHAPQGSFKAV